MFNAHSATPPPSHASDPSQTPGSVPAANPAQMARKTSEPMIFPRYCSWFMTTVGRMLTSLRPSVPICACCCSSSSAFWSFASGSPTHARHASTSRPSVSRIAVAHASTP